MKKLSYVFGVLVLAAFALSACGGPAPQAPAKEIQEAKKATTEAVREATGAKINPDILPQPRQRLADAPDLSNAKFVISNDAITKMMNAGVPGDVVRKLEEMKGKTWDNAHDFREALVKAIGAAATETYGRTIMMSAKVEELAEQPFTPGAAKPMVSAAAQPMGSMGSPEFKVVYFDFDKYNIKPEFNEAIAGNAAVLKADAAMTVVVEGHCDERGTTEYNLALGERRARAVRSALVDQGVNPRQMKIISYGEERPVDPGHNEEAWAKNRRSVLTITAR